MKVLSEDKLNGDVHMTEFEVVESVAQTAQGKTTSFFGNFSVAPMDTVEGFLVLLKDIENKKKDDFLAEQHLITYCHIFTNDRIIAYLSQGDHQQLARLF